MKEGRVSRMTEYGEGYVLKNSLLDLIEWDNDIEKWVIWDDDLNSLMTEKNDVAPVVHATTTDAGWDEIYCEWKTCNRCQGDNVSTAIYCNWCGARMDGGDEE